MSDKVFIDTNLWIYLYAKDPPEKSQKIEQIIVTRSQEIQISTQILGELFHVLIRKKFTSQSEAAAIILELVNDFPVLDIDTPKFYKLSKSIPDMAILIGIASLLQQLF